MRASRRAVSGFGGAKSAEYGSTRSANTPYRGAKSAEYRGAVRRLALRARLDLLARRVVAGLFFGLLPGLAAAAIAGTVPLPVAALEIAGLAAAAGTLAGCLAALLPRAHVRRLLIEADRSLGSKELASTAFELAAGAGGGTFAEAVIEDAAALLNRSPPRRMLGRLRLPLLPFIPVVVGLIALAALFPFDLRSLFVNRTPARGELALIGEDLRSQGQRLAEAARAQNLGRSLALSEELARLGSDLAEGKTQGDEAQGRMDDLERRMAEEYGLQMQGSPSAGQSGRNGIGPDGSSGTNSQPGTDQTSPGQGTLGSDEQGSGSTLNELSNALNALRDAQRKAAGDQSGTGSTDQASNPPQQTQDNQPRTGDGSQGQGSGSQQPGMGPGGPAAGQGLGMPGGAPGAAPGVAQGSGAQSEEPGSSGVGSSAGTVPSDQKTGSPSSIVKGGQGSLLRADAVPGEGDAAKFLVRALPQWTGSRLPEDRVLKSYAQAAESALARDEIPTELKEYVKGYFTIIGVAADGSAQ